MWYDDPEKFFEALQAGNHSRVSRMLNRNQVNAFSTTHDTSRYNPIQWVAYNGRHSRHYRVAEVLLKSPRFTDDAINANMPSFGRAGGHNAVHLAALHGNHITLKHLLASERCTNDAINDKNANNETALLLATWRCSNKAVNALLASKRFTDDSVNAQDADNNTALHSPAKNGDTQTIKDLLASGRLTSDTILAQNTNNKTALHLAAQNGWDQTMEALLISNPKLKPDAVFADALRKQDDSMRHAIEAAETAKAADTAAKQQEEAAKQKVKGRKKAKPLVKKYQAAIKNTQEKVAAAKAAQAEAEAATAAKAQLTAKAEAKAKAKATQHCLVNAKDDEGNTALHLACREGHAKTVKVLLASGKVTHQSVAESTNNKGKTVRDMAKRNLPDLLPTIEQYISDMAPRSAAQAAETGVDAVTGEGGSTALTSMAIPQPVCPANLSEIQEADQVTTMNNAPSFR